MTMNELTEQELHNLAMNEVGKTLEQKGWEFLAINSQLNKNPQFVCVDERNQKHFVIVKAILYPENPIDYDMIFMQTLKEHALKFNARIYYAGVGLANAKDYDLPLTTSSDYIVNFNGLIEL